MHTEDKLPRLNASAEGYQPLLLALAKERVAAKAPNTDFWLLSQSYLTFLAGERQAAIELAKGVRDARHTEAKTALLNAYEVFGWDRIGPEQEARLGTMLGAAANPENLQQYNDYWTRSTAPAKQSLLLEYVAHRYLQQGDIGKAFLVHNSLTDLPSVGSLALIENLISFTLKLHKTPFEASLLRSSFNNSKRTAISFLQEAKGTWYLQQGNTTEALKLMQAAYNSVEPERTIDAWVFSNNTLECFNCPVEEVMQDSVFLADVFSFIPRTMNLLELTQSLQQLEAMTQGETPWKAKLAHYLLGNYYFNVSNTGYFKNLLNPYQSNCCWSAYFYNKESSSAAKLAARNTYNLSGITRHHSMHHGLASLAEEHYNGVLERSKDRELNARTLYMRAKCELNRFYNEQYSESRWTYEYEEMDHYKTSFEELDRYYHDTRFVETLRCGFYDYYVSR